MNKTFDKIKRPSIKKSPLVTSVKYGSTNIFLNRTINPENKRKCTNRSPNFRSPHSDIMLNIERTQKILPVINSHCQIEGFSALSSNKSIHQNINLSSNSIANSLMRRNKVGLKGTYNNDHKYIPLRHLLRNKEKSKKTNKIDKEHRRHCILKLENRNEVCKVNSFEKRLFNEYHMKGISKDSAHINIEGSFIHLQKFTRHAKSRLESCTLSPMAKNRNNEFTMQLS
jgi:hypothetical protein